jgi:hypothetical protein
VERHDKEQIDFAGEVMYRADRRDDNALRIAIGQPEHREPEVEVLVITARDNLIVANEENRPWTDLVANAVARTHRRLEDFGDGRCFQPKTPGNGIAGDQQRFHPARRMAEQRKKDFNDCQPPTRQRHAV